MGIIAAKTPDSRISKTVPRFSVTAEDIASAGNISIQYLKPSSVVKPLTYQPIEDLGMLDPTSNLDVVQLQSQPYVSRLYSSFSSKRNYSYYYLLLVHGLVHLGQVKKVAFNSY